MIAKTLSRGLILVAALVATNSFAASHAAGDMKASEMMKMPMVDTDKDGMVSKAEYLEMAGKAFDMKAKAMKTKDGKMNASDYQQFLKELLGSQ
jgi:hypothetical protein